MSTKIYNGFIFKNAVTIDDAFEQLKGSRQVLVDLAKDTFNQESVRMATHSYDMDIPLKDGYSYLSHCRFNIEENIYKSKKEGYSSYWDYTSIIYVGKVEEKVLGYHALPRDFEEKFTKMKFFKEYGYWNNTDRKERVSQKAWDERGRVWDKLFGNAWTINKCMLRFDVVEVNDYSIMNERPLLDSYIPSDKSRIDRLADRLAQKDVEKVLSEIKDQSPSRLMDYLKSPEYKAVVENKKAQITLKPISIDILKGVSKDESLI